MQILRVSLWKSNGALLSLAGLSTRLCRHWRLNAITARSRPETTLTLKSISERLAVKASTHLNKRLYEERLGERQGSRVALDPLESKVTTQRIALRPKTPPAPVENVLEALFP